MSCENKNLLQREGTSELNRVLAALSVLFARVDERDAADLLLFAKRYASYLNFYNSSNTIDGDWESLMKMDISITLATLMKVDIAAVADYRKLLYKRIRLSPNDTEAKTQFKFVFDLIFSLIRLIDEQYSLIDPALEIKFRIRNTIENKMQQAFLIVDQLFNDFKAEGWVDTSLADLDGEAPLAIRSCSDYDKNNLISKPEWGIPPVDPVITGITLSAAPSERENIICIINHNIFNSQIDSLFKGITEIIQQAAKMFEETVIDFPGHTPHYALYLTFIKLFKHAQNELNSYTQRHLDFYYKDTLQLINKPAEPDAAHLVFELQKPVNKHLLKKDSLFKGGKDAIGKEISYSLTDDIVLNKSTVAQIHAQQLIYPSGSLQASPVAASADGAGTPIKTADQSWFTFGDTKKAGFAKTGFAIASNILFMKEGARTVAITVYFEKPVLNVFSSRAPIHSFSAELTGEKGWHIIKNVQLYVFKHNKGQRFVFVFGLTADDPSIVPYSEAIHKENFIVDLPIVKLLLKQGETGAIPYTALHDKSISSVDISISVAGLKDLVLSNDTGAIDASKPFKPFGDFPGTGSSFYIGSREVFQKDITGIDLSFDWKNEPRDDNSGQQYLMPARYLRQSKWTESYTIVNDHITFNAASPFTKTVMGFDPNEPLQPNTLEGFLRIQLNSGQFSLKQFMSNVQSQLNSFSIVENKDNSKIHDLVVDSPPPVPEEIILDSFSLNYTAKSTIPFNEAELPVHDIFYHIGPFGHSRIHSVLFDSAPNREATRRQTLVPNIIDDGSLLIGLDNAEAGLVVNLLFQVSDGSSNPLKNMQSLNWFFLSANNSWRKFEKQFVIDRTVNFTQSGIVTLTLPDDASKASSIVKNGLIWIKVTVKENCDAVCKMVQIIAQAAKIVLVEDESKNIEFRKPLPAKTISKLIISDASVKTVNQPFDSFGGRIKESDEHFYLRVSERLRHKQRAITIWDYEHIILEQFPEIFKVKCLNHSGFFFRNNEEHFCENYPGHVTIITLPNLKDKTNKNPLRPYTSIRLLQNILDYLQTIISPFVKLHVRNPAFEEILFDFEVKFYDNLDESFYLQLLNTEIERFLCPWSYDTKTEISFGGKIRKSAILNFVEERPYVDYVTCFSMNQVVKRIGSTIIKEQRDIEVAEGTTSRSILVSYFDEETGARHIIKSPATCDC